MVFSKIFYYHCIFLCGTFGFALDLVASTNKVGMEDRTHNRNPFFQLDLVPNHIGIY